MTRALAFVLALAAASPAIAGPYLKRHLYLNEELNTSGWGGGDLDLAGDQLYDSTGPTEIGTAAGCTTSHAMADGLLSCSGAEFDGTTRFDSTTLFYSNLTVRNLIPINIGNGAEFILRRNSTLTELQLISTDCDAGGGTDCNVMEVDEGVPYVTFPGGLVAEDPVYHDVNETTSPAEPHTCNASGVGSVQYVDDDDDSSAAYFCACIATGDDGAGAPNAWDWRRFDDLTTACPAY